LIVKAVLPMLDSGSQPSGGCLASDVAQKALVDCLSCLSGAASLPQHGSDADLPWFQPGRALVHCRIQLGSVALDVLVEPTPTSAPVPAVRGALRQLDAALASKPVRVEVLLGDIDVELGALQAMGVGDTLRLDKPLQLPAEVFLDGHKLPCKAFLGKVDGHIAIELAR
jgi:flagellar motor switch/type III secretory pathway protein FliN